MTASPRRLSTSDSSSSSAFARKSPWRSAAERRLVLVDHEHVDDAEQVLRQRTDRRGIEHDRRAALPGDHRGLDDRLERGLELQQQDVRFGDGPALVLGEVDEHPVGPRIDDDGVLGVIVDRDEGGARRGVDAAQQQLDAGLGEAGDESVGGGVFAQGRDEGDRCTGSRHSGHLVVALAARSRARAGGEQSLARRGDALDPVDEVEVGASDDDDAHPATAGGVGSSMACTLGQRPNPACRATTTASSSKSPAPSPTPRRTAAAYPLPVACTLPRC